MFFRTFQQPPFIDGGLQKSLQVYEKHKELKLHKAEHWFEFQTRNGMNVGVADTLKHVQQLSVFRLV